MTAPVVVTGATGFIGRRLAERLLEAGRTVRCPVRSPARAQDLARRGAEVVAGDVRTGEGLEDALRGAEAAVHLAGLVRAWSLAEYLETNAEGTRRVAAAAAAAGARRLVLVSSLAASGPGEPGKPVTEETEPRPVSAYGASKLAGERALHEAAGDRLEWSIVRPAIVYGPREKDLFALFRLCARRRRVPYTGPPGAQVSLVHADDLCDLLVRCLEAPPRSVYQASDGRPLTWAEVIHAIGRALGKEVRPVRVPLALAGGAALLGEALRPFRSRPPLVSLDKLREARERSWVTSPARARRELGWEPRIGFEEGAASTAAWYRAEGWL